MRELHVIYDIVVSDTHHLNSLLYCKVFFALKAFQQLFSFLCRIVVDCSFSMSSRQIVYADVSTPERREDYLQNCACIPNDPRRKRRVEQLMSSVPTDSPPIPLYQVPQRAPLAKEARVSEGPKHQYTFVTQGQREKLKELFEQHGTNHPVAWYERATGIKSGTCKNLITKLRKGQDLTPAKNQ